MNPLPLVLALKITKQQTDETQVALGLRGNRVYSYLLLGRFEADKPEEGLEFANIH